VIASILLTGHLSAGLAVLALHMLVLPRRIASHGRNAARIVVFVAFAAATHSATFLVLIALTPRPRC